MINRIDSDQMAEIKAKFTKNEVTAADNYDQRQFARKRPTVVFDISSTPQQLVENSIVGLAYPLRTDGKGGLELSSNAERVREQIMELLETRVSERVLRPFFGLQELIFETIDEYSLAQTIKSEINTNVPYVENVSVAVDLTDSGDANIFVKYSDRAGAISGVINYTFSAG